MSDAFGYGKPKGVALPDRTAPMEKQGPLHDAYQDRPAFRRGKARSWFDTSDPDGKGKAITQRVIEFLRVVQEQYELSPRDVAFAVQLVWLNIFNMEDFPLTPEEQKKARDDAHTYYMANRDRAPKPKAYR